MIDQQLIHTGNVAGMGQLTLSSDISTWSIGDWAAVLGIAYVSISLFFDLGHAGRAVGRGAKATQKGAKRLKKSATGGASTLGTVVAVGALAAAGYVGYELYTGSQTTGGTS